MIFLLDTNAISDLMREHSRVEQHLTQMSPADRVVVCTIVRGEIRYGIERLSPGRRRLDLEMKASRLFGAVPCEPVPANAADHYARIKGASRVKGSSLDENDLWIAATALALGATLVTRDRDFCAVDGLVVADWTQ